MGLISTDVVFTQVQIPELDEIKSRFFETTDIPLKINYNIPTTDHLRRYEEMKRSHPNIGDMYTMAGNFEALHKDFTSDLEFQSYTDRIEIMYVDDQKYFLYAMLRTLESLGGRINIKIPTKYKVKWPERKLSDNLKT